MLLQTAIVPVYCANGSIVSACILLDSASQRILMTEKLAKQLNLSSERKETLSISTFGSQGPQSIDTYVVHFTIITKKGSSMSLHANVLNQITSPILNQRGPLQKANLEFLQSITSEKVAYNHITYVTSIMWLNTEIIVSPWLKNSDFICDV